MEVGEHPGSAREADIADYGRAGRDRHVDADMPERGVIAWPVDDHAAVVNDSVCQDRGRVDDFRPGLDRVEARGRDRAEGTGFARVLRTLLRDMESAVSRGRRPARALDAPLSAPVPAGRACAATAKPAAKTTASINPIMRFMVILLLGCDRVP